MAQDTLMQTAARLAASLEALAALAAYVRVVTEDLDVDPRTRELLAALTEELLGGTSEIEPTAVPVVGMARAFLHQADELVEHPDRVGGWDHVDEGMLQAQGRLSTSVIGAFRAAERELGGLGQRLQATDATFLDVGTGTGWLAIAIARAYPRVQVVGIDIHEPALALARRNIADEQLTARVDVQRRDVVTVSDHSRFDAIWLPLPFLPADIVSPALVACARALRPDGWLLAGTYAGSGDRQSELLADLRTVRSGGHPWRADEVVDLMAQHGLTDAREVPRTWPAPVHLYAGRRP